MTTWHIPKYQRGSKDFPRRRQEDLHQPDTLAGGTSFYRVKNGQFTAVSCSDDLIALTGYSPGEYQEVTARDALGMIYRKDRLRVKSTFTNVLSTGQPVRIACRLRGKGNRLLWVRVNLGLVKQEGETLVFASFSSIKGKTAQQYSADEVCHVHLPKHTSRLKPQQIHWIGSRAPTPCGPEFPKKKRFQQDWPPPNDIPQTLVQGMTAGINLMDEARRQDAERCAYVRLLRQHHENLQSGAIVTMVSDLTENRVLEIRDRTETWISQFYKNSRDAFIKKLSMSIPDSKQRNNLLRLFSSHSLLNAYGNGRYTVGFDCFSISRDQPHGCYVHVVEEVAPDPSSGHLTGFFSVWNTTMTQVLHQSQEQLIGYRYDLIVGMNPEQDQYWRFSLENNRVSPVQSAGSLSALRNHFLNEEVLPCDREKCRQMLDVAYMNQELEEKSSYSFQYLVRIGDAVRAKKAIVFRMVGQPSWTCFARSDITDSPLEQQALFRTLAQTFEVFALVSPASDSCVLYTQQTILGNHPPEFFKGLTLLVERVFWGCGIDPSQQETIGNNLSPASMVNRLADEPDGYSFVTEVQEDGLSHYKHVSITWDNQTQENLCVVRRDITPSIREEAKQTQLLRSALATERDAYRAKQDFLSIMSHDIRTPMNAIVGMASLAMAHQDNPMQLEECLRIIKDSSNHLRNLIGDILDMGRIERGRLILSKEPFSQTEQLQMVAERTQILAKEKDVQFHYSIQLQHDTCVGDPVGIDRILENLIGNAVKFTPAGGSVTLDLMELPHQNKHTGWFRYTISDTGIGMSHETMQHLYDPFYREKSDQVSQTEGSGLGLSIVRNLVDSAGGAMDVSSSPGKGTQFVVNLPLMFASADEVTKLAETKLPSGSIPCNQCLKNRHILLVEDHPINRIVAQRLLEDAGAVITMAKNGLVGLEAFRSSVPGFFDAILMDLRMPVMDGYTAARSIRACQHPQAQEIPIIAMTANAFAQDVQHCLDAGMNAHVAKPVDQSRLLAALLQFISQ